MKENDLLKQWLDEEKIAYIQGWDFSHINDRYEEEKDLPWDYYQVIKKYLTADMKVLDIDTGGGEFLLSLDHPNVNLSAIEAYAPNVQLCKERLIPLGINFKEADSSCLPFNDDYFDMVINRHGSIDSKEIARVLKPGGLFISEQVGANNDRELIDLLLPQGSDIRFSKQYLENTKADFLKSGFSIIDEQVAYRPICFYDVGALVWYARVIEWEFPGFSVTNNWQQLLKAQEILEREGVIEGTIHRYLIVVKKC